jgi:hypothetical protein
MGRLKSNNESEDLPMFFLEILSGIKVWKGIVKMQAHILYLREPPLCSEAACFSPVQKLKICTLRVVYFFYFSSGFISL